MNWRQTSIGSWPQLGRSVSSPRYTPIFFLPNSPAKTGQFGQICDPCIRAGGILHSSGQLVPAWQPTHISIDEFLPESSPFNRFSEFRTAFAEIWLLFASGEYIVGDDYRYSQRGSRLWFADNSCRATTRKTDNRTKCIAHLQYA